MYNFKESYNLMKNANKIGIFTHRDADGDALGSAFSLYYHLKNLGKTVEVVSDSVVPPQLDFLGVSDLIKRKPSFEYDLVVATDANNKEMLGVVKPFFVADKSIQFDHHPSNPEFADVNNIELNVSSASEIVADFMLQNSLEITKEIGELLLTGMITDSGGFKFSSLTSNTFKIVSAILDKTGILISSIMRKVFESETRESFDMQKYAINHTEYLFDGKAVIIKLDYAFYKNSGIDPNSCKFLTRIGTEQKDVKITCLVSEVQPNVNKVSFRSKDGYDASACARVFGGGGHKEASGCKIHGNFYGVVEKLIRAIGDELQCRV